MSISIVHPAYGDNGIVVNASRENKAVSFSISSVNDAPTLHGFIITVRGGHYSKIIESPDGWSAGIIDYEAVLWTTQSHPIEPGSTENSFAIEVTQSGKSRLTGPSQTIPPHAWGTISIDV